MRKVLIIILSIVILGGVGWYLYTRNTQTQNGVPSTGDFSSFFPIGDNGDPTTVDGTLQQTPVETSTGLSAQTSAFKQISPDAVAGYSVFSTTVTTTTPSTVPKGKPTIQTAFKHFLRYVARSNGYIYETEDGSIPLQISNVYIPNIYEAFFGDKNLTALLRFLRPDAQTIATYSVPIPPANPDGTRTQKAGIYFPDKIIAAAPSPDGSQVARITTDANGAILSLTNTTNGKKVDIVRTSFREWILSWPTSKSLYLQTKASAQVPGYLYRVDLTDKKLHRVLGNINGLTASVSPSGAYVIYSQNSGDGFVTKILNTKTNTTQSLSLVLLPEKCTWIKNEDLICAGNTTVSPAQYPDAWYQGTVGFSDKIYRIYTQGAVYDTLYDNSDQTFDMTNLAADESLRALYFIDKPTGLLWQYTY